MRITQAIEDPLNLVNRVQGSPFTAASSLEEFLNPTGSTLKVTGSKSGMGASLQVTTSMLPALQLAPLEV